MLNRITENKPLLRKIGNTQIICGGLLLLFIVLNKFVVTWVEVNLAYIPLIAIDIVVGFVLVSQSKEE